MKPIFIISDFKIFPKMLLSWISVNCRFDSYFRFITKEKIHSFLICSFYCCLVKGCAIRGLVAYKPVAYKKTKLSCFLIFNFICSFTIINKTRTLFILDIYKSERFSDLVFCFKFSVYNFLIRAMPCPDCF